jgi:hypothetical protein
LEISEYAIAADAGLQVIEHQEAIDRRVSVLSNEEMVTQPLQLAAFQGATSSKWKV